MFKFIDLFAGIGGIRIPFNRLGGSCVFSSEWDKYAQITYKENFRETPDGDITEIPAKKIPNHDLLLAGFPCQPFSVAGLKKGFSDERGELFFHITKIIKFHRPKIILLENVKGLVVHDKGKTIKAIVDVLEKMNYKVFYKVLNAKNFGVPQNRERVYVVAFNKKKFKNIDFDFPNSTGKKVKVGDILEKKVGVEYTISDKLWKGHQRRKKEHKEKGNGFGYNLFDKNSEYTSTISARYYKDGSEILISQKNKNPRKLTPREASRLQGFPKKFKIPVSNTQAYKQFGNSVSVPVITAIAKKIKKFL
jgi:DNA (cytosine-5)-methyltransferase 1